MSEISLEILWAFDNKTKMRTVSWKTICKPLNCGGLGIRYIAASSEAVLQREAWYIASKKNSIWFDWVSSKNIRGQFFWIPSNSSWRWRGILCQSSASIFIILLALAAVIILFLVRPMASMWASCRWFWNQACAWLRAGDEYKRQRNGIWSLPRASAHHLESYLPANLEYFSASRWFWWWNCLEVLGARIIQSQFSFFF